MPQKKAEIDTGHSGRVEMAASRAESIGADTRRKWPIRIGEMITGAPLDPDFYRNSSREDIFMNLAPTVTRFLNAGRLPQQALENLGGGAVFNSRDTITGLVNFLRNRKRIDLNQPYRQHPLDKPREFFDPFIDIK